MSPEIIFSSIGALILLALPVAGLMFFIIIVAAREGGWGRWGRYVLCICSVLLAVLFLRPHEHVFQALDSSAFRHMARAFLAGRSFHDVDQAMLDLPEEVRPWVFQDPDELSRGNRSTRDRSFQITSLRDGTTVPFFYPLLPLAMAGFDVVVPGLAMDYLVPLVFLSFVLATLVVAGRSGGWQGIVLVTALWVATPIPAWLGRGCYLETVSAALIGLAVLSWFLSVPVRGANAHLRVGATDETITAAKDCRPPVKEGLRIDAIPMHTAAKDCRPPGCDHEASSVGMPSLAFFALGLAVAFHPVMLLPVLPLGLLMLMTSRGWRRAAVGIAAGLLGVLPLVVMTEWVCAPYGALRIKNILSALSANASIRPALLIMLLISALVLFSIPLWIRIRTWRIPSKAVWLLRGICIVVWVMPTLLAVRYWESGQGPVVMRGLFEFYDGMQWYVAIMIALLLLGTAFMRGLGRPLTVVTIVALILPMFLYLKGAENMGLWSQRRLIVPWVLLLISAMASGVHLLGYIRADGLRGRLMRVSLVALIVAVCLVNPIRWPAPYTVRYEAGADEFVDDLAEEFDGATVCFDYHTHSLPLTVLPDRSIYGLSSLSAPGLPLMADWLRKEAEIKPVYWVTAYRNPGIEEGVRLESMGVRSVRLKRARAKTVLPAVRSSYTLSVEVLKVVPLAEGEAAVLDKTFELGRRMGSNIPQLGVRGDWGRSDIGLTGPDGGRLLAQWTRAGSGVIGPVPRPGGQVRIVMEASASRSDGRDVQVIQVIPPWGGDGLALTISNNYTRAEGLLVRPTDQNDYEKLTGSYRLVPLWPYNPADADIKGFKRDLGVLLHRIRIKDRSENLRSEG